MAKTVEIRNKKASHLYELTDVTTAGIELLGTEIKSIRQGKASLSDSFCFFIENELFVKMHITEYSHGGFVNHEPKRERKLLLTRRELDRFSRKSSVKGYTIVPVRLFISENGYAKLEIALAKGKRSFDKRESLKDKDNKRELDRMMKV